MRHYLVGFWLALAALVLVNTLLWIPGQVLAVDPPATTPAPAPDPAAPADPTATAAPAAPATPAAPAAPAAPPRPPPEIRLNAPLPGPGEGTRTIGPGEASSGGYIMQYVTVIYSYLAGIAGLLAVLMMVLGGFQVMSSATNPGGVEAGKQKIINAVGGLILLLVSALLLYSINPNAFTVYETPPTPPGPAAPGPDTSTTK